MKDPAVLFYTQDFITGTLLMTDEINLFNWNIIYIFVMSKIVMNVQS